MKEETYLEPESFYMNIATGSVAKGQEWENDFNTREDQNKSWEDWAGSRTLLEVELINNEWIEVQ